MKMELRVVKNAFKYVTIAFAILIMTIQLYLITTEISKNDLSMHSSFPKDIPNINYCEQSNMNSVSDLAVKSTIAFVAGCLFSEKKFIRFGVI